MDDLEKDALLCLLQEMTTHQQWVIPANCNPDILAVGSNNRNGSRSSFSNYGTALDIVAPGENVCTTTTGSNYSTSISGTSFSCPTAAAVAALVISVNPNLTQNRLLIF